jgi:deazaflavin-dependent oxidoreductase (nitroreductase family)
MDPGYPSYGVQRSRLPRLNLGSIQSLDDHPAWYGNLKTTPRCRALFEGEWRDYAAYEAEGEERERVWKLAVENYAGYADYQARVSRRIPVMILGRCAA